MPLLYMHAHQEFMIQRGPHIVPPGKLIRLILKTFCSSAVAAKRQPQPLRVPQWQPHGQPQCEPRVFCFMTNISMPTWLIRMLGTTPASCPRHARF